MRHYSNMVKITAFGVIRQMRVDLKEIIGWINQIEELNESLSVESYDTLISTKIPFEKQIKRIEPLFKDTIDSIRNSKWGLPDTAQTEEIVYAIDDADSRFKELKDEAKNLEKFWDTERSLQFHKTTEIVMEICGEIRDTLNYAHKELQKVG